MDPKKFEEIITCCVCYEFFNEGNRCPRILSCGHTFCHACLEKLLVQSATCPTCKGQIPFQAAELIPVNFSVKNMISIHESATSGMLESNEYCTEHCNRKELRCMDCELWICRICSILFHKRCRTLLVKEAYRELKKQIALRVENGLKILEKIDRAIMESIQINEEEEKEIIDTICANENELSECKKRIKIFHLLKSENFKLCENLRLLQIPSNYQFEYFDVYRWSYFPCNVEDLRKLCEVMPVFAEEDENEKLFGKVTVSEGKIWISSFQPEKPRGPMYPVKKFLQQFTASDGLPKKVFLKLAPTDERSLEEVDLIIETVGDSARVRNFVLLCTALKGESYNGNKLILLEGDFDDLCYKINSIPASVVEGIDVDKRTVACRIGMIAGNLNDSGFSIITKRNNNNELPGYSAYLIGNIVCGFQELDEIRANSFLIKDCGFVI